MAENSSVRRSVGRRVEDELQLLAEAEVEHLVGLVEDDRAELAEVEMAALQVVAQAPRRADDDLAARRQRPLLAPRVHAADAGDDARLGVEPCSSRCTCMASSRVGAMTRAWGAPARPRLPSRRADVGQGQAIGHRLARAGLGGDQQVAAAGAGSSTASCTGVRLA